MCINKQCLASVLKPVKLHLFAAGYCKHPEFITIRGGSLLAVRIPALFACIEHPTAGLILFDTGYSALFFRETNSWPNRLYRLLTPIAFREEESAAASLRSIGYESEDVKFIIISHFHADHIAGLRDFPNATFIYTQKAFEAVKSLSGFAALRAAFLSGLLPNDFEKRSMLIDPAKTTAFPPSYPFPSGMDVLGDGSLLAVELSGHAVGQIGLFLSTERYSYLLCADAAWSSRAYRENRPPHPITRLIVPERELYEKNFQKLVFLHQRHPELRIVPSHCPEVWEQWIQGRELL